MAEEKTTDNVEKILSELNTVEDRKQPWSPTAIHHSKPYCPSPEFFSGTGFCGTGEKDRPERAPGAPDRWGRS